MKLTHSDFENLTVNSTNWKSSANEWKKQEGRFEDTDYRNTDLLPVTYEHARAYWVESYPCVLFVKAFLEAIKQDYRIYFDTADDTYMVTTNYGGDL